MSTEKNVKIKSSPAVVQVVTWRGWSWLKICAFQTYLESFASPDNAHASTGSYRTGAGAE